MKKGIGKYETKHLSWEELIRLRSCLEKDGYQEWKCMITLGVFFALRISDLLNLKWSTLRVDGEPVHSFEVYEIKTRNSKPKPRIITISEDGRKAIKELYLKTNPIGIKTFVFSPHRDKAASEKYINDALKKFFEMYSVDYKGNISSHLFRKTFGYHYAEMNEFSMESLVFLMKVLRHTTLQQTMVYLGIEDRQISKVYMNACSF